MKILIDKEEILKRLSGAPTGYITTGINAVSNALFNGDIIKFYYNYLKPEKFLYGQVRYDVNRKDYCIHFNNFKIANNNEECDDIYFKDLKCKPNKGMMNVILNINIDKCFSFPLEHNDLIRKYRINLDAYSDGVKVLEKQGEEKFYDKMVEYYKEEMIELLPHEIENTLVNINDPLLKIHIESTIDGKNIEKLLSVNLDKVLNKINQHLQENNISIDDNKTNEFMINNDTVRISYHYNKRPKHEILIFITPVV